MISAMNEQEIELWCERQIDRLDRQYMSTDMSEEEYDTEMARINSQTELMVFEL
jgi:hypothetical protein